MPLLEPEKAQKQKDPNQVFEKDPVKVYKLDKVGWIAGRCLFGL